MKTTVNERIKLLRTHLNQTQSEFSSLIGITSTQLSRIENGNGEPQKSTIKHILENIDVSKDWLIDGIGDFKAQVKVNNKLMENNPWKDALVQRLIDEANEWKSKHSQAMDMMAKMIDRIQVGKLKAFDLTASNPKGKFASRAAA